MNRERKYIPPCRAVAFFLILFPLLVVFGCGVTPGPGSSPAKPQSPPTQPPPPQPPPIVGQSGSVSISPQYAALAPGKKLQFHAAANNGGTLEWLVNGVQGGSATTGTIDASGNYTAPSTIPLSTNFTVTAALAASPTTNFATAVVSVINPGVVTPSANPQVAYYTIYLPAPGSVHVEFGPDTSYGLPTSAQATPSSNGGQVVVEVAGMLAQKLYHMRAQVTLADGATFTDTDQTFTTGIPPGTATVTASAQNGQTPQPGIEMFDTLIPYEPAQAFATDLSGNVIWTYTYTGSKEDAIQPIKLLPNGHFLVQISYASSIAVKKGTIVPGTLDEIREVDLAGNTIRSLTQAQLAASLTAKGYSLTLGSLHHDILALPNGHLVLLVSVTKQVGGTNVLGDALIDVDQNFQPDWVWNSFDHLDVNRRPYLFPDWTHSNSLLYSKDDGDLLLSMRHQNWIIKIDFANGQGSGNVLWRLGQGGDFKLVGGNDPADWFYSQHGIAYFSPNTSGVFKLGIMDNGDDRPAAAGAPACPIAPNPPNASCYSTVPVLQVDETAMTATLVFHYVPPANMYSFFGGDVADLPNGDLEADFCAAAGGAVVQELNMTGSSPQLVWQAVTKGTNQYRAERLPSLYPGVQW